MASSASSSPSSVRRSNIELHYEGSIKYCKCRRKGLRMKAPRRTSWTDENLGRRFYGCPNYQVQSCGFFEWHDESFPDRAKEFLNEMKVDRRLLLAENRQLKESFEGKVREEDIETEIAQLWSKLRRLEEAQVVDYQKARNRIVIACPCFPVMADIHCLRCKEHMIFGYDS